APVLVAQAHPLAAVQNENNAVMVTGQAVGDTLFYGPGAGGLPTANSVLSDITTVTKNLVLQTNGNQFNNYHQHYVPAAPTDVKYPYYLSLTMPDIPGQMLQLTQIMTDLGASFSEIAQEPAPDGETAHVVIITHTMDEQQLHAFQARIEQSPTLTLQAAYKVLN
ncbi:MAG: ACT domain-containing protein, partial [Limosilactobacillus sp.]|nr:ACT domain-containing protein [Limosilactobacillus sp.]